MIATYETKEHNYVATKIVYCDNYNQSLYRRTTRKYLIEFI